MDVFAVLAAVSFSRTQVPPVLWLRPDGLVTVSSKAVDPTLSPGTRKIKTDHGVGYDLDGKRSGVLFPDFQPFKLDARVTVSGWVFLRSYVNDGPGAQILFRGDDRCGLDPYTLVIHCDGTVNFGISQADGMGMKVSAEMPLFRWVHVTANYDSDSGWMNLYLNGERVAVGRATRRPFVNLDPGWAPGVGIGNVQNEKGPHNQPINGILFDVRLYGDFLSPEDVGYQPW